MTPHAASRIGLHPGLSSALDGRVRAMTMNPETDTIHRPAVRFRVVLPGLSIVSALRRPHRAVRC